MTTGEGGAVYTSDPLLAKIALSMRDWGRDCSCGSGEDNRCGQPGSRAGSARFRPDTITNTFTATSATI